MSSKRWVETTGKRFGPDTLRGREPYLFHIPYVDVDARPRDPQGAAFYIPTAQGVGIGALGTTRPTS